MEIEENSAENLTKSSQINLKNSQLFNSVK